MKTKMKNDLGGKMNEKNDLTDFLFSFFKHLTYEEKEILVILFNSEYALSVRQIRKKYSIRVASYLTTSTDLKFFYNDIIKKLPFLSKEIKSDLECIPNFKLLSVLENMTDVQVDKFVSVINKISSRKVPSYETIRNILESFEKQGIVKKREVKKKRIDREEKDRQ